MIPVVMRINYAGELQLLTIIDRVWTSPLKTSSEVRSLPNCPLRPRFEPTLAGYVGYCLNREFGLLAKKIPGVLYLNAVHPPPPGTPVKYVAWRTSSQLTEDECGSHLPRLTAAPDRAEIDESSTIGQVAERLRLIEQGEISSRRKKI